MTEALWEVRQQTMHDGEVRLFAPIGAFRLDPANVNEHPEQNIAGIAASLAEYGQQTPIKVSVLGVVQKGNGTLLAARKLGWQSVWYSLSDLDGMRQVAYNIADNQTSRTSRFNDEKLGKTLQGVLSEGSVPVEATGFTEAQVDALIAKLDKQVKAFEEEPRAIRESFEIVVDCNSQTMRRDLMERFRQEGLNCRVN